jgi:hypothetical protein
VGGERASEWVVRAVAQCLHMKRLSSSVTNMTAHSAPASQVSPARWHKVAPPASSMSFPHHANGINVADRRITDLADGRLPIIVGLALSRKGRICVIAPGVTLLPADVPRRCRIDPGLTPPHRALALVKVVIEGLACGVVRGSKVELSGQNSL